MSNIKMYGTPTCRDCVIAKQVFQELGTDYEFINIEDSQEATENRPLYHQYWSIFEHLRPVYRP